MHFTSYTHGLQSRQEWINFIELYPYNDKPCYLVLNFCDSILSMNQIEKMYAFLYCLIAENLNIRI